MAFYLFLSLSIQVIAENVEREGKENCLFWAYDCAGAPNPHTSFETKSIFMFIDRIAKVFYAGNISEELRKITLTINECWHDIFDLRRENLESEKFQEPLDFLYINGGRMSTGVKVVSLENITIARRESSYNFYRYNVFLFLTKFFL